MNQKHSSRHLQEQWDASVARALEGQPRSSELDEHQLNAAAGLPVESGLQAGGLWGSSHGCSNNCQSNEGCGP